MTDIVFMDTETLGLDPDAPIWEFAAVRRITEGPEIDSMMVAGMVPAIEKELHLFIQHDPHPWLGTLPDEFARDYLQRYRNLSAVSPGDAAAHVRSFLSGRPHVVGAVPDFDTTRIRRQLLEPFKIADPWHYHLIDIENVAVGYLVGVGKQAVNDGVLPELDMDLVALPWKSDDLSRAIGVDPEQFERHTAMGDVRWVMAQWDAVMGGAR